MSRVLLELIPNASLKIIGSKPLISQNLPPAVHYEPNFTGQYFRNSGQVSRDGLALARLVGAAENEIEFADVAASSKIVLARKRNKDEPDTLVKFPGFLDSIRYAIPFATEWMWPVKKICWSSRSGDPAHQRDAQTDESLPEFLRRRLGRGISRRFSDILASSITGVSSSNNVSAVTSLPRFWFAEKRWRSVLLGSLLFDRFSPSRSVGELPSLMLSDSLKQRASTGGRLWTITGGIAKLEDMLQEGFMEDPRVEWVVENNEEEKREAIVDAAQSDCTILAGFDLLSALSDGPSMLSNPPDFAILEKSNKVHSISLEWEGVSILPRRLKSVGHLWRFDGQGRSADPLTGLTVVGTSFRSSLFPGVYKGRTLITVFVNETANAGLPRVKSTADQVTSLAIDYVTRHLGISQVPSFVSPVSLEEVPAFELGHQTALESLDNWRVLNNPKLQFCGKGFYVSSATDVISDCFELGRTLQKRFANYPLVDREQDADRSRGGRWSKAEKLIRAVRF